MNANDTLRGLEAIRDPRIAICRSFLRRRGLDLSTSADAVWSRCLSEAEGNNPEAQYVLSALLLTGVLGRQDEEMGIRWCSKAAEVGYLPAIYTMADLFVSGEAGVAKDPDHGLLLLKRAADADYPPAVISLAMAHLHGFHTPKDRDKALSMLRKAAESGDKHAQLNLGSELVESRDPAEGKEGVKWLEAAASRGLHSAHYALALLYQEGNQLVRADPQLAAHHIQLGQKLEDEWHRRIGFRHDGREL